MTRAPSRYSGNGTVREAATEVGFSVLADVELFGFAQSGYSKTTFDEIALLRSASIVVLLKE